MMMLPMLTWGQEFYQPSEIDVMWRVWDSSGTFNWLIESGQKVNVSINPKIQYTNEHGGSNSTYSVTEATVCFVRNNKLLALTFSKSQGIRMYTESSVYKLADTYSVIAAALSSLKGPKHGGANIKVVQMMQDLKEHVDDVTDEEQVRAYLRKLVRKEAFDRRGLIYGMGHAVYSLSDPRARVFKGFVEQLSQEKHREKEFKLMSDVERIAAGLIAKERKIYKGVSANVDFYSGFVYSMLGLPHELYTPIFAVARISGWSAHRIEELINCGKIIRPAYKSISPHNEYTPLSER